MKNTEQIDELRVWFELILELKLRGLTPQQVMAALVDEKQNLQNSKLVSNGFIGKNINNSSWCF